MTDIITILQRKTIKKILGDYNVDISPAAEINLTTEEINIFNHLIISPYH